MSPMIIRTQPAMFRLKNEVLARTAKARMAPTAMSARPAPVFIECPFVAASPPTAVVGVMRVERGSGGRGEVFRGVEQAAAQVVQGPRQQPGHVHLGDAEPGADL